MWVIYAYDVKRAWKKALSEWEWQKSMIQEGEEGSKEFQSDTD